MFYLIGLVIAGIIATGAWFTAEHRGYAAGFSERDGQCKVQLAGIESRAIEAERQSVALKEKGRILGDRLAEQAATAKAQIDELEGRLNRALKDFSSSRRAFDAYRLRILNQQSAADKNGASEARPAAPGVDAADGRAVAPDRSGPTRNDDGSGTSERAVAAWVIGARASYARCVTNLHALQDWVRGITEFESAHSRRPI